MRKIREVLRLHASGLSNRRIASSLGLGPTSVGVYLRRARRAGLSWPLHEEFDDAVLERRLFPPSALPAEGCALPDWGELHRELKKPGVTLSLLWEEYRASFPEGYGYSRFCDLYRAWKGRLSPTMRQHHVAGEKLFVDYAGGTMTVFDSGSGESRQAQIFVAVLGASNYSYVEATWSQSLADWIGAHGRAFAFFDGVTRQVVSDNLKSGVTKACFYEPQVNRTYEEMAAHYGTAVVPARPRKPRDKAKVEAGVLVVQRWVLAKLRHRRFFSLIELNKAIGELVAQLNLRVTRHLGASRLHLFAQLDQPALLPLPAEPYAYARWQAGRSGLDYHVEIDKHYYSVPHSLIREKLWARITETTIEIFHRGKRVASHMRADPVIDAPERRHTTIREHMPSAHRRLADWSPEKIHKKAGTIGPNTQALSEIILRERPHPEQGFRACIGILRLAKSHGEKRLEVACGRALEIGARSYTSVASILKNNLDRQTSPRSSDAAAENPAIDHPNIRGPRYYH